MEFLVLVLLKILMAAVTTKARPTDFPPNLAKVLNDHSSLIRTVAEIGSISNASAESSSILEQSANIRPKSDKKTWEQIQIKKQNKKREEPSYEKNENFTSLDMLSFNSVELITKVVVFQGQKVFKRKLVFEEVDITIINLRQALEGLNPLVFNTGTIIKGNKNTFLITPFMSYHGSLKEECSLSHGMMVDLASLEFEDVNTFLDMPIMVTDVLVIEKRIRCETNNVESEIFYDIACARHLFSFSRNTNIRLENNYKNYYDV